MDILFSSYNYRCRKNLGATLLFVMFLELIIGGVILPYQESQRAQAVVDVIGGPVAWPKWATDMAAQVVQIAKAAYTAAGTWASAAVDLWNKSNTILKEALKVAWNVLRKKLLDMLVNDIITWIQGGGTPRFVTDWQGFLRTAADKAAGQLIDKMGLGFLCSKFSFQLRLALSSPAKFDESATCTLSAAISNIDNFMADFSKGGWRGWVKISESQNNYMGAYFYALNEKYAVMSAAADAAKNDAGSSAGFLGDKVCAKRQCPNRTTGARGAEEAYSGSSLGWTQDQLDQGEGNSCECLQWTTRTPGRVAGDALQQAAGVDIENLIQAKEFAEYAAAIIDAVINRIFKEGVALMAPSGAGTSSGYGPGSPVIPGINAPASITVNVSAYDKASSDSAEISGLNEQQILLQENTNKLISEDQKNLAVLNSIKTSQINSLQTLTSLLQNNCTLPSGVSSSNIAGSSQTTSTCTTVSGVITNCPCTTSTVEQIKLIDASGIGEITASKTTTQNYTTDSESGFGFGFCALNQNSISYVSQSTTAAVESQITAMNTEIANIQNELSKIITATDSTLDYQIKADAYLTAYENWKNGDLTAATSTAEAAMNAAKPIAITANQAAIPSTSTEFKDFTRETMEKSNGMVEKFSETMTKRGSIAGCSYASISPTCLQTDLCNAQAAESSYQSLLNSCLYSP